MVTTARVCCTVLALVIVAGLLSVESTSKVHHWWMSIFTVIPIVFTLVVYFVDLKWSGRIESKAIAVVDEVLDEAEAKTKEAELVRERLAVKIGADDTKDARQKRDDPGLSAEEGSGTR